ncbi:Ankyrin repeat protein 1 [Giardia muris]|uniref:Ankyrin repeat protein 1 n=1 Tax=Giardia muris TaxID=5742 RepID=A0A4Z1T0Y0_GIAMU|nr:Ankyrin repeat protein 1 [Giardia muris]|eukprot:TNJ27563.1 Ankyrin repeat protein 1 [Giardia muris]
MSVTGLMMAAQNGDLEGVKRNIKDVGRKDEDGWTALMWADRHGETDYVRLLLPEAGKKTKERRLIPLFGKSTTFFFLERRLS